MKIVVAEYVTGGGLGRETVPPSLAREGGQMRQALAGDLLAVPGVELAVFNDRRLPAPRLGPRAEIVEIGEDQPFEAAWKAWMVRCDAVWPVAPETGGVLERLCQDVEGAGGALLTSPAAAVRLAASKRETARRLRDFGLPAVPCWPLDQFQSDGGPSAFHVVKPDDGVGCEGARIVRDPARFRPAGGPEGWIVQPLLAGEALSLSALFARGRSRLLSVNRQIVGQTADGFTLRACQVNAFADSDGRWQALAGRVAEAMPELWGYVGIDLILGEDGPAILEVNPRLTTSYAGLRLATGENPAALILELLATGCLPPPRWHPGASVEINLEP